VKGQVVQPNGTSCHRQHGTHQATDITSHCKTNTECFVFIAGFIGRFSYSGFECNWTKTKQLVFSKPCPQKGSIKLKNKFSKYFSSGWILLVPDLSLLMYFDITLPRHKSSKIEGWGPPLTPSTQSNLFPKLICFFHVETHKVSTSIWGGSHVLLHKPWHEQVHSARWSHSARSSCTAPERVRKRFKFFCK